jgi:hypothetical protein
MSPLFIIFTLARLAAAFFLIWAFWPHPYKYFEALRFWIMTVSIFGVYCSIQWKQQGWAWVFGVIAILFNPFAKIALGRQNWNYVDAIVAAVFIASIFLLKDKPSNS